jgi:hypothetical protein
VIVGGLRGIRHRGGRTPLLVALAMALALMLLLSAAPPGAGRGGGGGAPGAGAATQPKSGVGAPEEGAGARAAPPIARYESAGPIQQAASALLEGYRDSGDAALAHAGYVDLLGRVWSCTVRGRSWVDVCFVRQLDDERSEVEVIRMDVDDWKDAYEGEFG